NPDSCDGSGTCQSNHQPDGTLCGDAGTQCTNQDKIGRAACRESGFQPAGTACGEPSKRQCDNPDTWKGSGTCQLNHQPDGTFCGDAGTQCTNQDTCLSGLCHDSGFPTSARACG